MKLLTLFFSLIVAVTPLLGQTANDENEGAQITSAVAADAFIFSWWGVAGRTYFIQQSTELMDWDYITIIESGQDAVIQWGFTSNAERYFLKLHFTDEPMVDPFDADIDFDGISNWQELLNGTDPFVIDSGDDPDGDNLASLAELLAGTDSQLNAASDPSLFFTELIVLTPIE